MGNIDLRRLVCPAYHSTAQQPARVITHDEWHPVGRVGVEKALSVRMERKRPLPNKKSSVMIFFLNVNTFYFLS